MTGLLERGALALPEMISVTVSRPPLLLEARDHLDCSQPADFQTLSNRADVAFARLLIASWPHQKQEA